MEKLQSSFKNMVIVLLLITGIAAAALASVYQATKAPIAQAKALKQQEAIKAVVPEYNNDPLAEVKVYEVDGGTVKVFPAKMDGEAVGYAIETFTMNGFSGLVRVMLGVDTECTILNYSVLEHKETPGLGSKMQEWFVAKGDIRGMNRSKNTLIVSKDGGDVDAITAATISSRAFLDAINRGIKTLEKELPSKGQSIPSQFTTEQALTKVCTGYDFAMSAKKEMKVEGGVITAYPVQKEGEIVAMAYETFSDKAYNKIIRILVLTDLDGIIKDYCILEQNESDGYGSQMEQWFKSKGNVIGMNIKDVKIKSKGGTLDGISGATITSNAFIDALQKIQL